MSVKASCHQHLLEGVFHPAVGTGDVTKVIELKKGYNLTDEKHFVHFLLCVIRRNPSQLNVVPIPLHLHLRDRARIHPDFVAL